jgi:hypothetical protein
MPRTVFLYILLITMFVAGCGMPATPELLNTPTPEPPATNRPALDSWTIKMKQSGGFMGLSRLVEISSYGKFTIVDERAKKTITGEFSADELSKINEQVLSFKYIPLTEPDGTSCADCFIYDVEIQINGKKISAQLNDINLPNSGLDSLVGTLRSLIETTLK